MSIGLYIIGDEILSGRRQDQHLNAVISLLKPLELQLDWVSMLSDNLESLEQNFKRSVANNDFVLSAGGIGGTPDDLTRIAIANTLELPLSAHTQALPILQRKFGYNLTPQRLRMIEFPQGAELIPNPINEIPGFSIAQHHFVPGFPEMAKPMMKWVLDNKFGGTDNTKIELAVRVDNIREGALIPLMEEIIKNYPPTSVFSLPNISASNPSVELGVRGKEDTVAEAFEYMKKGLKRLDLDWTEL